MAFCPTLVLTIMIDITKLDTIFKQQFYLIFLEVSIMIDLFKKGLFFGVGLFEEGRERVEAVVDDLIKAGELANEKRAETIDKFVQKIKEQEKMISEKINTEIKKAIDRLGIPTKADFDKLAQEVEALKKKLEQQ